MKSLTISTLALLTAVSAANAQDINSTFGFTDLRASFDGAGSLSIEDVMLSGSAGTTGDVSFFGGASPSVVQYDAGFQTLATSADVSFDMDVTNITASTADSVGTFSITDANGDQLNGSFEGSWVNGFGFAFFNGEVTSASYDDNTDGVFTSADGTDSFVTSDSLLDGGISFLARLPEWFTSTSGFSDASTQADAILLPTPASLALAGFGFALATRRKR